MEYENPFVTQCETYGWFMSEQSRALGIPGGTLRALHAGKLPALSEALRARVEVRGWDFNKLRAAYAAWYAQESVVGALPTDIDMARLSRMEGAIVRALRAGVRGERAIAQAVGVSRREVQTFLRRGIRPEALAQ